MKRLMVAVLQYYVMEKEKFFRRFMRRSMPAAGLVSKGTAAKIAGLAAASSDPKQYLLNKMLMGIGEGSRDSNLIYLIVKRSEYKPYSRFDINLLRNFWKFY